MPHSTVTDIEKLSVLNSKLTKDSYFALTQFLLTQHENIIKRLNIKFNTLTPEVLGYVVDFLEPHNSLKELSIELPVCKQSFDQIQRILKSQPQLEQISLGIYNLGSQGNNPSEKQLEELNKTIKSCVNLKDIFISRFRPGELECDFIQMLINNNKRVWWKEFDHRVPQYQLSLLKKFGDKINWMTHLSFEKAYSKINAINSMAVLLKSNCQNLESLAFNQVSFTSPQDYGLANHILADENIAFNKLESIEITKASPELLEFVNIIVSKAPNLKSISIKDSQVWDRRHGFKIPDLTNATKLKALTITGCSLKAPSGDKLAEIVEKCSELEKFDVAKNSLTPRALQKILAVLVTRTNLKHVDFSQNPATSNAVNHADERIDELVISMIEQNQALNTLKLGRYKLYTNYSAHLTRALHSHLALETLEFTPESMTVLNNILEVNTSLCEVKLPAISKKKRTGNEIDKYRNAMGRIERNRNIKKSLKDHVKSQVITLLTPYYKAEDSSNVSKLPSELIHLILQYIPANKTAELFGLRERARIELCALQNKKRLREDKEFALEQQTAEFSRELTSETQPQDVKRRRRTTAKTNNDQTAAIANSELDSSIPVVSLSLPGTSTAEPLIFSSTYPTILNSDSADLANHSLNTSIGDNDDYSRLAKLMDNVGEEVSFIPLDDDDLENNTETADEESMEDIPSNFWKLL